MTEKKDVVLIGGGPNALVAACYLAKAGLKPIVLEKRNVLGGVAVTEEFAPGFKTSSVFHATGPFLPSIVRDLGLEQHGLSFIQTEVRVFAPAPDQEAVQLHRHVVGDLRPVDGHFLEDVGNLPPERRNQRPRIGQRKRHVGGFPLDDRHLLSRFLGVLHRAVQLRPGRPPCIRR